MVINTKVTIDGTQYTDIIDIKCNRKMGESNATSNFSITFNNQYGNHSSDFSLNDEVVIFADKDDPIIIVPTKSPIAHYKLNDNLADTVVVDSAGSNNGTLTGGDNTEDLSAEGKINEALNFNGVDDNVDLVAGNILIPDKDSWSIGAWFYADTIGVNENANRIVTIQRAEGSTAISLQTGSDDKITIHHKDVDGTGTTVPIKTISKETWYHLFVTYDGTDIKSYVNGVLEDTTTDSMSTIASIAGRIGSISGNVLMFDGKIDDVRFYDFPLSNNEVNLIYNNGDGTEHTNNDIDSKLLTGIIEDIQFSGRGNKERLIISGRDIGAVLQDILVEPRIFNNKEVSEIVSTLIIQNVPAGLITANNINVTSTTLDKITFNNISIFDALTELGVLSGFYFYVDADKDLHFEEKDSIDSGLVFGVQKIGEPIAHYKMNDNEASTDVVDSAGSNTGTATFNTEDNTTTGKINDALTFNGVGGDTPVSHYKLNDNLADAVVVDSGTGGNTGNSEDKNGDVNTDTINATGKINGALTFVGTGGDGNYVDLGDDTDFEFGGNNFSISAWVKPSTFADTMTIFSKYNTGGDNREYYFYMLSNRQIRFWTTDDGTNTSTLTAVAGTLYPNDTTNFHHVAITRIGDTVTFYLDGTSIGTGTIFETIATGTADAYIGAVTNSTTTPDHEFQGDIDDLRIYDKSLTKADIESIYNDGDGTEETSDYVNLGDKFDIGSEDNFSYGGWVYLHSIRDNPTASRTEERTIIGGRHGDRDSLSISNDLKVNFRLDDTEVLSNSSISLNEWTHVFVTYKYTSASVTEAKIFINGVLDRTRIGVEDAFYSGTRWIGWDERFENVWDGELDDIRVYNFTLSDNEVKLIYNNNNGTETTDLDSEVSNVLEGNFKTTDNEIFNKVTVYGDRQLTGAEETFITGTDNTGSIYTLTDKPHNVEVYLSGATNTFYQPGGVLYIDDPATDTAKYLVDFATKQVILTSGATAGDNTVPAGSIINIQYNRSTPLIKITKDTDSQDSYGQKHKIIVDKNIKDIREATDKANEILSSSKDPKTRGKLIMDGVLSVTPGNIGSVNLPFQGQTGSSYQIVSADYDFNRINNQSENVLTVELNKHTSNFVDVVKDNILRLRRLEASEVDTSVTVVESSTGSIGISGTSLVIVTNLGSGFQFHTTNKAILNSPGALLGPYNLGSNVYQNGVKI